MAQETDSLVLELLKRLHARFDRFEADLIDVKLRLSSLEKHFAEQASQLALLNVRLTGSTRGSGASSAAST